MVDGEAGKGGRYRKVDPKKFDEGYERIWGEKEESDEDDKDRDDISRQRED